MKKILSFFLVFCLFSFSIPILAAAPETSAQGVILMEAHTGTILYEKNAYTKLYPASITKLMTALLVTEKLPDGTLISKSQNSIDTVPGDSSNIGLELGDTYNKTTGLYGLLLGSDNYIAHDLAIATSGTIRNFADEMNTRAKAMGCKNTHFVNPHGYHDPDHYTTPYDMALIAKAAFNNETVQKIAGTVSYNFYITNKDKTLCITNTSRLLKNQTPYYNEHVIATKTGFHNEAGQTIVAKGVYGNMQLIAVVMNTKTPHQYEDVNYLFQYASANFCVEKKNNYYGLNNLTIPKWVKKSAAQAVKAGWMKPSQDYTDTLYVDDVVAMLKKAGSTYGGVTLNEATKLTSRRSGETLTRSELKQIISFASHKWNKTMPVCNSADLSQTASFAEAVSLIDRLTAK